MRGTVAKKLRQVAAKEGLKLNVLKAKWNSLNHKQKGAIHHV